ARGDRLRGVRRHGEPHRLQRSRAALRAPAGAAPRRRAREPRAEEPPRAAEPRNRAAAAARPRGPGRAARGAAQDRRGAARAARPRNARGRGARARGPSLRHARDRRADARSAPRARARRGGRRRSRRGRASPPRLRARQGEGRAPRRRHGRGRALAGADAATVHEPKERTPLELVVRLGRAQRSGATELGELRVRGAGGDLVPLAELGAFVTRPAEQPIYHKDLERVVYVIGDVAGRPPADVIFAMERPGADGLPSGLRAGWAGEGEWKITVDVFRDLGLAFAAALVGIWVLLVIETRSLTLPLVIMLAIPL